nr:hypothetical protein [Methylibium rhizosphaerae]
MFGEHQHALGRVAVDEGAAHQQQQRPRHADDRQHGAQHQRITGRAQHEPRQGHQRELVAQHRDECAAHPPVEVGPRSGAIRSKSPFIQRSIRRIHRWITGWICGESGGTPRSMASRTAAKRGA